MYFLERNERWLKEKPYLLDYVPEPPATKSNAITESCNVSIEDIRGREQEFDFKKNGFCISSLSSGMTAAEFDDDSKVKAVYLPEVGDKVKKLLGATRVQIYDYTVRKREMNYPLSSGGHYPNKQPASVAHVDTTPACMEQMMRTMNSPEVADFLATKKYQSVNIWKPLRGPVRDWPLALCDPQSVSANDLQPRDTVKRDSFIETYQVHHTKNQRWYFISEQMSDEAWVFLQADSSRTGMHGVPHAAFMDPKVDGNVDPRESVEVRCLVYYDEDEME